MAFKIKKIRETMKSLELYMLYEVIVNIYLKMLTHLSSVADHQNNLKKKYFVQLFSHPNVMVPDSVFPYLL